SVGTREISLLARGAQSTARTTFEAPEWHGLNANGVPSSCPGLPRIAWAILGGLGQDCQPQRGYVQTRRHRPQPRWAEGETTTGLSGDTEKSLWANRACVGRSHD